MNILKTEKAKTIANILNGEQTMLVMKQAPKNGQGHWWYLYCSKGKPLLFDKNKNVYFTGRYVNTNIEKHNANSNIYANAEYELFNCKHLEGKVVARFWCDKVEEIYFEREVIGEICDMPMFPRTNSLSTQELIEKSCTKYLPYGETEIGNYLDDKGYAIHISKLEVFDEPKELGEFHTVNKIGIPQYQFGKGTCDYKKLTKAPQNYCYIDDFFFNNEETKEPESVLIDEKETDGYCR